jgi:hypothetical protein
MQIQSQHLSNFLFIFKNTLKKKKIIFLKIYLPLHKKRDIINKTHNYCNAFKDIFKGTLSELFKKKN